MREVVWYINLEVKMHGTPRKLHNI